jgi:WD40-like Beta Propeller Repeat
MKRRLAVLVTAASVLAIGVHPAGGLVQPGFERFSDWSPPINLEAPLNTAAEESAPALSDDGRSLYFNRNRNAVGDNHEDLYVSRRSGPHDEWGDPVPLATINMPESHERNAALSRDGLLLFFSSDRPGGFGGLDLYVSHRTDRFDDQGWSAPVNLGGNVNSAAGDVGPAYVEDEGGSPVLYFTSTRPAPAGFGLADIYVSRIGADGSFGPPTLVRELSSPSGDARTTIRADGLELVLHSNRPGPPPSCPAISPPPSGGQDLWVSTRANVADPWSCPVNLGSVLNSGSNDLQALLSDDAETLFFSSSRPGGSGSDDLWMSRREPLSTDQTNTVGQ